MTNRPRVKFSELIYASVALAFLVGASLVFTHHALDAEHMLGAALLIMALAYFILKPKPVRLLKTPVWVPEAPEGSIPRYASRRWARGDIPQRDVCQGSERAEGVRGMTPLEQGAKAFSDGEPLINNPYLRYTHDWDLWNEGWRDEWWRTATWRPR